MPRTKQQIMGYWLNEPAIADHRRIKEAMRDLAQSGYGIVRLMLRNTNFTHRAPETVAAVAAAAGAAHHYGLQIALDCEPHAQIVARDMGSLFPEAMSVRLVRAETRVVNGHFTLRFLCPGVDAHMARWDGVEAAFLLRGESPEKMEMPAYGLRWEGIRYADAAWHADHPYVAGKPGDSRHVCTLTGKSDAPSGTRLVVYARVADCCLVDFWSDGCRRYFETLLDCYRDIPLDGVGWDEPAIGGDWSTYFYGAAFVKAFERRHGYALADRLPRLDATGLSPETDRVRLDYYGTLNEGVAQAQENLIAYSRSLFGDDILLGTHHTWQGEGGINDYRAGAVDYFRLNDSMDAGYTDCSWWDEDSVCYAYALGSSLGRLTPSGEAEINTWDAKPTVGQVEYHVRLMSLMNITWFNIWYGDNSDTCQYPAHYTWPATVRATRQHRARQQRLGAARPVVEIAVWHGWEGVCAINLPEIAGAHKTCCMNLSRLFLERSVPFDFIDSRLLAASAIEGETLANRLGRYRVVVLPYAAALPRDAWQQCLLFARSGGKLVFVGPPPERDTDGQPLGEEFAALLEMPAVSLTEYLAGIEALAALPAARPDYIDLSYPLSGSAEQLLISPEGEPHGYRSPSGSMVYLSDLDPRQRLLNCLESWLAPEVSCHSDSILWRLYRDGERSVLVLAARKERRMRGIVQWNGHALEIQDGTVALLELQNEKLTVEGEDVVWRTMTLLSN